MLKRHFRQAAEGDFPGVLENIRRSEINLAVWHDPLSPESKAYLAGLDPEKLAGGREFRDGYFVDIGKLKAVSARLPDKSITRLLENLPPGNGKDALAADIKTLVRAFSKAVRADKIGGSLLIFKPSPDGGGFWHADENRHRGIITLKGDRGTLWAPDDAPLKQEDETKIYWGKVDPKKQKFIQEMQPQDFAVFKCLPLPNQLHHATPPPSMSREYRIALIMGPR